jgi:hypothetical protein
MANVSGTATYWNSLRYEGRLWTAASVPGQNGTGTPFLTLMGGLNADNMRVVPDFDFAMVNEYTFPTAAQPDITENASGSAPTAVSPIDSQARNACGIYQESVNVTYKKLSTEARMATGIVEDGVGYWASEGDPIQDAISRNKAYVMTKLARDYNYTSLNGAFAQSTDSDTASKSRGVITAVTTNAVAASGAELSEALLQEVFGNLSDSTSNQAFNAMPIMFVPSKQKQNISKIYGNQPESWNIGGVDIQLIYTDFGPIGVIVEPMVNVSDASTDTILIASMAACKPVFNEVVTDQGNAGLLVYEDLAKTGAAYKGQFVGHMGLDYSHEKMHAKLTGLAQTRI